MKLHLALGFLLAVLFNQNLLTVHVEAGDDFVRTRRVHFFLNGNPYFANGFNAYWLMYVGSDPSQRPKVSTAFREAAAHGLTVARTWAFSDGGYRPLQYAPGSYNEQMFKGLDFVIAEARKYRIKLILSLANNYESFGGKKQYVNWARSQGQYLTSDDDFFRNPVVKGYYKNHVKTVLNRYNSFTGMHYKDDPTIMAWELMNEPRCTSDPSGRTIQAWIMEMASHVKSIDRNHLLEAGLEGFYGQSTPQKKRLNPSLDIGTDFIANNQIPGIDFATVHSYPDQWLSSSSEQYQLSFLNNWLDAHIRDARIILRKPILLAEFGKSWKDPGFNTYQRDQLFNIVYNKIYWSAKTGGPASGGLFWQLLAGGMESFRDGYEIILSERSSTANVIAQQSHKLDQIRKIFTRRRNVQRWKRARAKRRGGWHALLGHACFATSSDRNMVSTIRAHNLRKLCTVPNIAFIGNKDILVSQTTSINSFRKQHVPNAINMLELNSLLKNLVKTGDLHEARQMFDVMPQRDEVSWTIIISGYVRAMKSSEALLLFSKMWVSPGLSMDPFCLSIALKACALEFNLNYGELLHGYLVKSGFINSVFAGSALLDMYAKFGKIELGIKVFDEMPIKSVVSWTAIITGLVHGGYYKKGLVYLSEMRKSGVEYDSYTLAIVLKACACLGALNFGREIHTHTVKRGFNDTSYVANSLSTMYNKCGKLDYGLRLFDKMNTRDVVSWTSIITTYVQMREDVNAIEAFTRMQEAGVSPNEFTFAAVIASCSGLVRISWGEQLHAHVLRIGLANTLSVANSLMTMYSKCGQISSAAMVFHGMSRRDTISWSTIIAVYSQGGYGEEAFEHLSWMRKEGPKPTQFAFASVLSVCGNMAILEQGRQLHAHVLSIGLEQEEMIQSALVNMYSKCGCIKDAEKVFNEAENYNIVTWTAMINGYADHGYIHETINLFKMLSKVGLKPDSVTFIGLLTACSHAGLADLGFHYFNLMSSEYQIRPSKEHYGCMIDLLCRAGRLTEAEEMIKSMPFHRDDVVWSTLLRACRVQGNVDCGERAAEKLLEMDPNCAGTHITLANIYSAKGKWREAADVRKMMRTKGVMKEPGWSWIKVKDRVSAFVAGERSYPEGEEIYGMLDLLASRVDISVQELGSLLDLED
ncbi:hypothetical protein ES319_D11G199700v1 [Gossypium barbadense]|uniref:mannan endo-1,4-beta-mannosidase n=1 Tax=Gossypium barbadense TaxID=3634 RepID=A0A5J5PE07_GOSBA|nr:hypothetical protein ES319_D11G199700v1 [Gossypium barbadense]PPD99790.1 hypothetical protein GOBAR_DD03196 [Gossypium barbadense]